MSKPTSAVQKILDFYTGQDPRIVKKIATLLGSGRLAGTGKLIILPVDQGFEHGPDRSFGKNPAGYDPLYHFRLAIESGCNAYAAPLGALEAGAEEFKGKIPLILKLNNSETLSEGDPAPAVTASVQDAVRLGCVAIGFTIYPGSPKSKETYEELRAIAAEARAAGLAVIVWSYPRGGQLDTTEKQQAVDVISYAAHIACQLGAHIVKVKPPVDFIFSDKAREVYAKNGNTTAELKDRIAHVVQSCFAGRRIVIFSGGDAKDDEAVFAELRQIRDGGGYGSIIGRNSFQRPWDDAIAFLKKAQDIYAGKA